MVYLERQIVYMRQVTGPDQTIAFAPYRLILTGNDVSQLRLGSDYGVVCVIYRTHLAMAHLSLMFKIARALTELIPHATIGDTQRHIWPCYSIHFLSRADPEL